MLKVMCIFLFLMQSGLVVAQTEKEMEDFVRELETKNFAGWQGITFICRYDESDSVLAKICLKGTTDFKFLVTVAEIDYNIVEPNDFYSSTFHSGIHDHIVLEYRLVATKNNNQSAAKAIYGHLVFVQTYRDAVDMHAKESTILSLPRDGDINLWNRSLIGSGRPDTMGDSISEEFGTYFKEAITHFLEYSTSQK